MERLRQLPDQSVQCCVTSPPYWGLRDYGVNGQLGLEKTPEEYVNKLVDGFREVRRVLRDDGTLWLNLGDSYSGSGKGPAGNLGAVHDERNLWKVNGGSNSGNIPEGLKPKDLVGIPWRVAFALQADGWYLRSDIIWAKPNPMPESVTDRPTKSHEYIFLLSKSARYFYDAEAIKEPLAYPEETRRPVGSKGAWQLDGREQRENGGGSSYEGYPTLRNKRSVWTVTTQPYSEAHFATFPPDLIKPCIMAGSSVAGKRCDCDDLILTPTGIGEIEDPSMTTGRAGMNRPRRPDEGRRPVTKREQREWAKQLKSSPHLEQMEAEAGKESFAHYLRTDDSGARPPRPDLLALWLGRGWLKPVTPCDCPVEEADTVLDPFAGSGTTGMVALELGRKAILIELNPEYVKLIHDRTFVTPGLPL